MAMRWINREGWGPKRFVRRLKMTVAYDGQRFKGWQSHAEGDGVQDYLEKALEVLCRRPVVVQGAGRTDSGVHALGQVAHADVESKRFPLRQWREALNAQLPPEVRVISTAAAPQSFHARFSAKGKIYRYQIWNSQVLPPHQRGRCWHVYKPLDAAKMQAHAQQFVGEKDFAAFAANRGFTETSTVRMVQSAQVRQHGRLITFTVQGNGFLYHQVRLMAGCLVRANFPEAPPDDIAHKLATGAEAKCQHAAPPEGLYLVKVLY